MHMTTRGNQGLLPLNLEINRATRRKMTHTHPREEMTSTSASMGGSHGRGIPTHIPPHIHNHPPEDRPQGRPQILLEPTIEEKPQVEIGGHSDPIPIEELFDAPQWAKGVSCCTKEMDAQRLIEEYMTPDFSMHNYIYVPPLENQNFHIHPSVLNLVQNSPFGGLPSEDPHVHFTRFIQACGMHKQEGMSDEVIRLNLFPFSVIGEASRWLDSQDDHHFWSWPQLHKEFMNEFFPLTKTMKVSKQVQEF